MSRGSRAVEAAGRQSAPNGASRANLLIRGGEVNAKSWMWAVCWMVFLVLSASATHAEQTQIACITCHEALGGALSKPIADWKGSIHYQHGITCDLCHGGNAKVVVGNVRQLPPTEFAAILSAAMSKEHGFVGKPSGQALFNMCARCHSATVKMFASSIMGKAYLQKRGGPSCVTCHTAHHNVIPAVPKVCAKCHKDTTGFTQINAMNVTHATFVNLSKIRIRLAKEKTEGTRPAVAPRFTGELGSYQIGLLAFGGVIFLFLIGCIIYMILEKER
jgi:Zn finger protein HypA/HybF involved in hydrogenase expression